MQRPMIILPILSLLALGGCSDTSKPQDQRVVDKKVPDRSTVDLVVDQAPPDVPFVDRQLGEKSLGKDLRTEKQPGDLPKKDTQPADFGPASIYGTITRTISPVGDGKGELFVGVYLPGFPVQLAGVQVTADLSSPSAKVNYAIYSAPAGNYSLFAFLDDNGNATPFPFLLPDAGDLVMAAPIAVTVGTTPQKIDIALDKIEGSFTDGGGDANSAVGVLKGKVTATVAPSGDGKGPLYISLHDKVPPAGLLFSTAISNADLSSPYAVDSYFISLITPGNYYLQAFLDDNSNNNPFAPGPDKGDMVNGKTIQLHIVGGVTNTQDVVLDKIKP